MSKINKYIISIVLSIMFCPGCNAIRDIGLGIAARQYFFGKNNSTEGIESPDKAPKIEYVKPEFSPEAHK